MRKALLVLLCLGLLSSCVTDNPVFQKPGSTQQDFDHDSWECERDSNIATTTYGPGMRGWHNWKLYERCMKGHGWILQNP